MGFLDFFRKKKKGEENKEEKIDSRENEVDYRTYWGISYESNSKSQSSDYIKRFDNEEITVTEDGVLKVPLFWKGVKNGVFVVPEEATKIDMFDLSFRDDIKTLVLHENVRFIGDFLSPSGRFRHNLKSVVGLENNEIMKSIGGFTGCTKLKSFYIPESVRLIRENAFNGCTSLESINIPSNCWAISPFSFAGCVNLQSVEIPPSMTMISSSAFQGCHNLVVTFLDDEIEFYHTIDIEIGDKEISFPAGDIIIENKALNDVKEVVVYNSDVISKITKSGYRGVLTYIQDDVKVSYDLKQLAEQQIEDEGNFLI